MCDQHVYLTICFNSIDLLTQYAFFDEYLEYHVSLPVLSVAGFCFGVIFLSLAICFGQVIINGFAYHIQNGKSISNC